jgi:hypothetical protein
MPGHATRPCLRIRSQQFARTRPPQTCSCTRRALRKGFCRSPMRQTTREKLDLNMPLTSRNILVEMVVRAGSNRRPSAFQAEAKSGARRLCWLSLDGLDQS